MPCRALQEANIVCRSTLRDNWIGISVSTLHLQNSDNTIRHDEWWRIVSGHAVSGCIEEIAGFLC